MSKWRERSIPNYENFINYLSLLSWTALQNVIFHKYIADKVILGVKRVQRGRAFIYILGLLTNNTLLKLYYNTNEICFPVDIYTCIKWRASKSMAYKYVFVSGLNFIYIKGYVNKYNHQVILQISTVFEIGFFNAYEECQVSRTYSDLHMH